MATPVSTPIKIRVQAKGGKFLGDDIGGAEVTVRDAQTGQWLAGGVVQGDSGSLQTTYAANASRSVVVNSATSTVYWLVPNPGNTTSQVVFHLPLTRPTLLEIEAFGPLGGLQSAERVVTRTWAIPGQAMTQDPGFVVELPGLLLQVQQPPTHLEAVRLPAQLSLLANVTMMCGCPIGNNPYWPSSEFTVSALIGPVGGVVQKTVTLSPPTALPSSFTGGYPMQAPGYYQAVFTAVQPSTGNLGTGTVTFFYKAS